MIALWIILGIVGVVLLFVLAARKAPRLPASPPLPPTRARGGTPPVEQKSPFEYDEDNPMDWWDNQFGPHGFKD